MHLNFNIFEGCTIWNNVGWVWISQQFVSTGGERTLNIKILKLVKLSEVEWQCALYFIINFEAQIWCRSV